MPEIAWQLPAPKSPFFGGCLVYFWRLMLTLMCITVMGGLSTWKHINTNTRPANMISTIFHDQWDFLSFTYRMLHVSCGFPLVNIGKWFSDLRFLGVKVKRWMSFFGVMRALGLPSSSPCERINFGMPKSICDPVLVWFYVVHFKICLTPGHPFLTHTNIINTYHFSPCNIGVDPKCILSQRVFETWPENAELRALLLPFCVTPGISSRHLLHTLKFHMSALLGKGNCAGTLCSLLTERLFPQR